MKNQFTENLLLGLRECNRRKIRCRIIVASQYKTFVRDNKEVSFEQLREEILAQHKDFVLGCVRLDRTTDAWKQEITKLLRNENSDR